MWLKEKQVEVPAFFVSARDEIRTHTISRHPLKMVRLPISPPGHFLIGLQM